MRGDGRYVGSRDLWLFKVESESGWCLGVYRNKAGAKALRDRGLPLHNRVVRRGPEHRLGETGSTRHVRGEEGYWPPWRREA